MKRDKLYAIYTDFDYAFDSINPSILLAKLYYDHKFEENVRLVNKLILNTMKFKQYNLMTIISNRICNLSVLQKSHFELLLFKSFINDTSE